MEVNSDLQGRATIVARLTTQNKFPGNYSRQRTGRVKIVDFEAPPSDDCTICTRRQSLKTGWLLMLLSRLREGDGQIQFNSAADKSGTGF